MNLSSAQTTQSIAAELAHVRAEIAALDNQIAMHADDEHPAPSPRERAKLARKQNALERKFASLELHARAA